MEKSDLILGIHQALAHILWKTKRWRDVLLVGRSTTRASRGRKTEENGPGDGNAETEQASNEDVPTAGTSAGRKEENGPSLRFVNKVSPSPESDTESIEEAENRF